MSSAPKNRINPSFIDLCVARLNSIEARLDSIERGWRYPDLWFVNMDLECMATWVQGIPDLEKRVEQLGERYAKIAFVPAPGLPPKFLPTPRMIPSTRLDDNASPMTDAEIASMREALTGEGFPIDSALADGGGVVVIGDRTFNAWRLRQALAVGLIRGGSVARMDGLLQIILVAMSGSGISNFRIEEAASALAEAFPKNAKWFETRFAMIRRRLVEDGYLKRMSKSIWLRVDASNSHRAQVAIGILDYLELEADAEPCTMSDSDDRANGASE